MCQPQKKVTRRISSEIIEIIEIACKPKASNTLCRGISLKHSHLPPQPKKNSLF